MTLITVDVAIASLWTGDWKEKNKRDDFELNSKVFKKGSATRILETMPKLFGGLFFYHNCSSMCLLFLPTSRTMSKLQPQFKTLPRSLFLAHKPRLTCAMKLNMQSWNWIIHTEQQPGKGKVNKLYGIGMFSQLLLKRE